MKVVRSVICRVMTFGVLATSVACVEDDGTAIPDEVLVQLVVSPKQSELTAIGDSIVLKANSIDLRGSQLGSVDQFGAPEWRSLNPNIATVESNGVVRAKANGTTAVVVTAGGRVDTATIVVNQQLAHIALTPSEAVIVALGDTLRLRASVTDRNGFPVVGLPVYWQSVDPLLGSVDANGLVVVRKQGLLRVQARISGQVGNAQIEIDQEVAALALSHESSRQPVGTLLALTARPVDALGVIVEDATVSWTTSDASIATVSGTGVVTALAAGSATVTATSEARQKSARIDVDERSPGAPAQVTTISISPDAIELTVGTSQQFTATLKDAQGFSLASRSVSWSSSNSTVASISSSGNVIALSAGTSTITATSDGKSRTAQVRVISPVSPPAPVQVGSVSVNPTSVILMVDDRLQLIAQVRDSNGNAMSDQSITWLSSAPDIVSVNATGRVTGISPGSAIITATSGGKSSAVAVTVSNTPTTSAQVGSVTVTPSNANMVPGATVSLTASVKDVNGSILAGQNLTWVSSAPAIVKVAPDGLVTALAAGSATVSAMAAGKTGSSSIVVTAPQVTPPVVSSVTVTPNMLGLTVGSTTSLTAIVLDTNGNVLSSGATITWTSSNPAVATVSTTGVVTARTAGSSTITASANGKSGSAIIDVAVLARLAVTPDSVHLNSLGAQTSLVATVYDANGKVVSLPALTWNSSNPMVAWVDNAGRITARGVGTALIAASILCCNLADTVTVTVNQPQAASITISPNTARLQVGESTTLSATVRDASRNIISSAGVSWSSSNAAVATVLNGVVSATGAGNAVIRAWSGTATDSATITVSTTGGQITTVSVTPIMGSVLVNGVLQLTATAKDASGNVISGQPVTWSSGNASVATVSSGGLVTGLTAGTVVITATIGGTSGVAQITVGSLAGGSAARGAATWARECAQCHTSTQGWDLAHFGYTDTTIVRRALGHVTIADAGDIVAHVRSLPRADTMTPTRRPFQPGNVVLASDQEFGMRLFGTDQWPASLTRAELLAQDTRLIPVALPLPVWSDEMSEYDWLPGRAGAGQLPAGVRQAAQKELDTYYASPSFESVLSAESKVRAAAHDPLVVDAPCTYLTDPSRYDAQKCVDVAKWAASLIYVEGIRAGDVAGAGIRGTRSWWETGHLIHKAQQFHRALPERDLQIAGWIYLGWMWNRAPGRNSLYGAGPLDKLGLNRHVTWVILRTMVERPADSTPACADVETLGQWGATLWMPNALAFAYRELQYRAANNLLPTDKQFCADMINQAQVWVGRRLGTAAQLALKPLADATAAIVIK